MAKLKICGLKRVEDIDYVNELKVDYIGFILSDGYKRSIDFKRRNRLKIACQMISRQSEFLLTKIKNILIII